MNPSKFTSEPANHGVICIIPYCNAEAYILIALYYFPSKFTKKPSCRMFFRVCENHARQIGDSDTVVKVQVLN